MRYWLIVGLLFIRARGLAVRLFGEAAVEEAEKGIAT